MDCAILAATLNGAGAIMCGGWLVHELWFEDVRWHKLVHSIQLAGNVHRLIVHPGWIGVGRFLGDELWWIWGSGGWVHFLGGLAGFEMGPRQPCILGRQWFVHRLSVRLWFVQIPWPLVGR